MALWSGVVGVAVLAGAGVVFKDQIAEAYWAWILETGQAQDKERAIDALAALKSPLAVQPLVLRVAEFFQEPRIRNPSHVQRWYERQFLWIKEIHRRHRRKANAALIQALSDPLPTVRAACCMVIAELDSNRELFVPQLLVLVKADVDGMVRAMACAVLGGVAPGHPQVLPALMAALKDPDSRVRVQAANRLQFLGQRAVEAVPLLEQALDDPDEQVRRFAGLALEYIQPPAPGPEDGGE